MAGAEGRAVVPMHIHPHHAGERGCPLDLGMRTAKIIRIAQGRVGIVPAQRELAIRIGADDCTIRRAQGPFVLRAAGDIVRIVLTTICPGNGAHERTGGGALSSAPTGSCGATTGEALSLAEASR